MKAFYLFLLSVPSLAFAAEGKTPLGIMFGNVRTTGEDLLGVMGIAIFAVAVIIAAMGIYELTKPKREGGDGGKAVKMMIAGGALSVFGTVMAMLGHFVISGS